MARFVWFVLALFLLFISTSKAVTIKESTISGPIYFIIRNDPPYYIQDVMGNENFIEFTIKKDCINITRNQDAKLQLDNFKNIIQTVDYLSINGTVLTSEFLRLNNIWSRTLPKVSLPCGMAYRVHIDFTKIGPKTEYTILFGENSASIQVKSDASIVEINANGNYYRLGKDSGKYISMNASNNAELFDKLKGFRSSDDTTVDIFETGTNPTIQLWDLTPVMLRVKAISTIGGTTETWKSDYFLVNSNWTDTVFLFKSNNNANQGSIYWGVKYIAWKCSGMNLWSTSTADFRIRMAGNRTLWCVFTNDSNLQSPAIAWSYDNPIQGTGVQLTSDIRSQGTSNGMGFFSDSGTTLRANKGRYEFRWGVLNGSNTTVVNNAQVMAEILNQTPMIVDYVGTTTNKLDWANGTKGGDVFSTIQVGDVSTFQLTVVNTNVTDLWFTFNLSQIPGQTNAYFYKHHGNGKIKSTDLCIHLYNSSKWFINASVVNECGISLTANTPARSPEVYANESWSSVTNDTDYYTFAVWTRLNGSTTLNVSFQPNPIEPDEEPIPTTTTTTSTTPIPTTSTTPVPTTSTTPVPTTTTTTTYPTTCTVGCWETNETGYFVDCDTCILTLDCVATCRDLGGPCLADDYCYYSEIEQGYACGCCCDDVEPGTTTTTTTTTSTTTTTTIPTFNCTTKSSVCNASYIGTCGCVGDDEYFIAQCINTTNVVKWDNYNRIYCPFGCYNGTCNNGTITTFNMCSENQTKCGGPGSNYVIPCINGTDYYMNWAWNSSLWTACNFSCFAGQCVVYPSGSAIGYCSENEITCAGNFLVYCTDANNDGVYEWDLNNKTRCNYACERTMSGDLRIASCKNSPPSYAYTFNKYVQAISVGLNSGFSTIGDKFFFIVFIMIGLSLAVTLKFGSLFGIISGLAVLLIGVVFGWVPLFAGVIIGVIASAIFLVGEKINEKE